MQVGMATKKEMLRVVDQVLSENLSDIDEAYTLAEANLDLTVKIRLEPGKDTGTSITGDLSFIKGSKIKDKYFGYADEQQQTMFEEEAS